jgi:outer membrane protein
MLRGIDRKGKPMSPKPARLLVLILLAPSGLFAQGVPQEAAQGVAQQTLMPMAEVVRRAVDRDPGVRAREADREAARSEIDRTRAERLPKLYLSTNAGAGQEPNDLADVLLTGLTPVAVTDPVTRSRLADLSASRPYVIPAARLENMLFDGGQTGAAIRSARLTADKAAVDEGATREAEAYAAASNFLNLAYDQAFSRYLEEYEGVAELTAAAIRDQAAAGRATDSEALAAEAKLQAAKTALEDNRDDLRLESSLLRQQASLPTETAFDTRPLESRLVEAQAPPNPLPIQEEGGPGTSAAFSPDKNADLQIASLDTRLQEEAVQTARARRLPSVNLVAEYGFAFSNLLFTFRPGYDVGVQANFPLFTSHELEQSVKTELYRADAARLRQEKVAASLREEDLETSAQGRKLARNSQAARSQLAQAEENYRVARLKYDQGAGSASNLMEGAELLLSSRRQCLDLARSSLLLHWTRLRMQGELLGELKGEGQLPK